LKKFWIDIIDLFFVSQQFIRALLVSISRGSW